MSAVLPVPKPIAYQELSFADRVETVNRLYLLGMLAMCSVIGFMAWQMFKMSQVVEHTHPLIVRVDGYGRPEVVDVNTQQLVPTEREMKYFLTRFTDLYFSRDRATVARDYPLSGYFMAPTLFSAQQAEDAKSKWLEKFLASGDPDQNVDVKNITIQKLGASEYQAQVCFDKLYSSAGSGTTKTEKYIATLHFVVDAKRVTNELIPYNPLGFFIDHIKTDQGFE